MRPDLGRHDLVRVEPAAFEAYAAYLRDRPFLGAGALACGWAEAGRPLIVRRIGPGDPDHCIPLGLPLPPDAEGRRRIAIALPPDGLAPVRSPTLAEARTSAPAAWHPTLDALDAVGARHGLVPRPFGSLLWQAVTGLAYLTAGSDLDVLWPLADAWEPDRLRGLLDGIAAVAERAPMRLDGEVLCPDGGGIQWRELRGTPAGGAVLVKYRDRIAMHPAADLRGTFAIPAPAGGHP